LRLAAVARVFDDDAHAMLAVVVSEIAHDPDAWMVHADDRRNPLGGAEPEGRDVSRRRDRIAVKRDDMELMARKGEAADLAGAGIKDVE